MIPAAHIQQWTAHAPWPDPRQVEQDLIISRALCDLFGSDKLKGKIAFRGGTAINKLLFSKPLRYSEDIDLVQTQAEPIKDTVAEIRDVVSWLGKCSCDAAAHSAKSRRDCPVNVGDLQSILTDLGHLLRKVGAGKKADELDGFCRSLEPFSSQKMSELLAQIVRAEEIVRTGLPPAKPKRTAAAKVDPTEIFQRLEALYQHAADSAVSREQILSAFDDLEKMNLPQKQLEQLGPRLHVTQKRLKKDELLKRMRQSVLERKGQAERVLS